MTGILSEYAMEDLKRVVATECLTDSDGAWRSRAGNGSPDEGLLLQEPQARFLDKRPSIAASLEAGPVWRERQE